MALVLHFLSSTPICSNHPNYLFLSTRQDPFETKPIDEPRASRPISSISTRPISIWWRSSRFAIDTLEGRRRRSPERRRGGGSAMAKFEARRDALGLAEVAKKLREAFQDVSDGKRKEKKEEKEPEKRRKKEKSKRSDDANGSDQAMAADESHGAQSSDEDRMDERIEGSEPDEMEAETSLAPSEGEDEGLREAHQPTDTSFERSLQALKKVQAECLKAQLVREKKVNKMSEAEKGVYIDICGRFSAKLALAMVDSLRRLRAMMGKRITDPDPVGSRLAEQIETPQQGLDENSSPPISYTKIRLWSQIHVLNDEAVGQTRHAIQQALNEATGEDEGLTTSGKSEEQTKKTFKDVYFSMFADAFGDDLDEIRKQEEKTSKRGSINVELLKRAIEMGTDIFEPWEQELLIEQHSAEKHHK